MSDVINAKPNEATEWVIVRHTVVGPLFSTSVVGRYETQTDAIAALNQLIGNRPWFTEYSLERRLKLGGATVHVLATSAPGPRPSSDTPKP